MLLWEAAYLGAMMTAAPRGDLEPMLNIGSSTGEFRTRVQPWNHEYVFGPLAERGIQVVHGDIKQESGVDLVGDLADPGFVGLVRGIGFSSVVYFNVLEYVADRSEVALAVTSMVAPGGLIFVTVPTLHPYHPDPIDTMFRPSPQDLSALFPSSRIESGGIVPCRTYLDRIRSGGMSAPRFLASLLVSIYRSRRWLQIRLTSWLPWQLEVTCVTLRRLEAPKQ